MIEHTRFFFVVIKSREIIKRRCMRQIVGQSTLGCGLRSTYFFFALDFQVIHLVLSFSVCVNVPDQFILFLLPHNYVLSVTYLLKHFFFIIFVHNFFLFYLSLYVHLFSLLFFKFKFLTTLPF